MGRLAEDYDGIGQYVMVSLSQSSVAAAFKARVAAGDFGGRRRIPMGTRVPVISIRGQLEVLLGNRPQPVVIPAPFVVRDDGNLSGTVGGFTVVAGDAFYVFLSTPTEFAVTSVGWSIGGQALAPVVGSPRVNGDTRQELWWLQNPNAGLGQIAGSNGTGSIPLIVWQVRGRGSETVDVYDESSGNSASSSISLIPAAGQLRLDAACHHHMGGGGAPGSAPPTPGAEQILGTALNTEAADVEFGSTQGGSGPATWAFTGSMTWVAQAILING
jgi:hypothetical protein